MLMFVSIQRDLVVLENFENIRTCNSLFSKKFLFVNEVQGVCSLVDEAKELVFYACTYILAYLIFAHLFAAAPYQPTSSTRPIQTNLTATPTATSSPPPTKALGPQKQQDQNIINGVIAGSIATFLLVIIVAVLGIAILVFKYSRRQRNSSALPNGTYRFVS